MREARVFVHSTLAGVLREEQPGIRYSFEYEQGYSGEPVSLTLPLGRRRYEYDRFPPFFDGLLPEGAQLDALLRRRKIDRDDCFSQLIAVGADLVGAVTVEELR